LRLVVHPASVQHDKRGVATPYDPSSPVNLEGHQLLRHLLKRSLVPPKGRKGWTLWVTLPCGHFLHDHCTVKLSAIRSDASASMRCPVASCHQEFSQPLSKQWFYGLSGTLPELGYSDGSVEIEPVVDPRSYNSLKMWTPQGADPDEWWAMPQDELLAQPTLVATTLAPRVPPAPPPPAPLPASKAAATPPAVASRN